jgi:hypothetical protein
MITNSELIKALRDLLSEAESLHECYNQTLADDGCSEAEEDSSIINARAILNSTKVPLR